MSLQISRTNDTRLDVKAASSYVASIDYKDIHGEVHASPHFRLETYRDLSRNYEAGKELLAPLNAYLNTLLFPEQKLIYEFFVNARKLLTEITPENHNATREALTSLTTKVISDTNIDEGLKEFVERSNIPFPDLSEAGSRPQDSANMTFLLPEYKELTAISLLCKFMAPIWGEYFRVVTEDMTDEVNKEKFCYEMLSPSLASGVLGIVFAKLLRYTLRIISGVVDNQSKNSSPAQSPVLYTLSKNGFGDMRFFDTICGVIFVKKMVIFDVYKSHSGDSDSPNLMRYISVSINSTTGSKISTMRVGTKEMLRIDPKENRSVQDNVTFSDNTARVSRVQADAPVAVEVAVEILTERLREKLGITKKDYNEAVEFYQFEILEFNPLTQSLLASFFDKTLGGSGLPDYLMSGLYNRLIILVQFYLIKNNLFGLVPFMSCRTGEILEYLNAVVVLTSSKIPEYAECVRTFSGSSEKLIPGWQQARGVGGKKPKEFEKINIVTQLQMLLNWITQYTHTYHLPHVMWKMMNVEKPPMDGEPIQYDDLIMAHLCRVFLDFHRPDNVFTNPPPVAV